MKNFIRKSITVALLSLPLLGSGHVWAQNCGAGYITEILHGGWHDSNI